MKELSKNFKAWFDVKKNAFRTVTLWCKYGGLNSSHSFVLSIQSTSGI
jgi:hypothetical protein